MRSIFQKTFTQSSTTAGNLCWIRYHSGATSWRDFALTAPGLRAMALLLYSSAGQFTIGLLHGKASARREECWRQDAQKVPKVGHVA
jgi:hypothetical protein